VIPSSHRATTTESVMPPWTIAITPFTSPAATIRVGCGSLAFPRLAPLESRRPPQGGRWGDHGRENWSRRHGAAAPRPQPPPVPRPARSYSAICASCHGKDAPEGTGGGEPETKPAGLRLVARRRNSFPRTRSASSSTAGRPPAHGNRLPGRTASGAGHRSSLPT
jgi:hypothetical protein